MVLAVLLASGVAYATFPGKNGNIAFVSNRDGNLEIYTVAPNGLDLKRLTENPAKDIQPTWSPDGRRMAFVSDRFGQQQIHLMDSSGSRVMQLTKARVQSISSAFSPTGSKIVFTRKGDLWVLKLQDRTLRRLTNTSAVEEGPTWSSNGKRIAFTQRATPNDRNSNGVFTITPRGSGIKKLTGSKVVVDNYPNWAPNSKEVVFRRYFRGV